MTQDVWLIETYFDWLRSEAISEPAERREYEGVLRLIHDIPFYWTIWSDESRAGDALSFRQSDFLGFQQDLDRLDQHWLEQWATATPSVFEVLVGIARRWSNYFEAPVSYFFNHLFTNLELVRYPGRELSGSSQDVVRIRMDEWMTRQFQPNGRGSPFPIHSDLLVHDLTKVDIWGQMNAYSAEHFQ